MSQGSSVYVGDRVQTRDRPWRVRGRQALSGSLTALELEALDHDEPRRLSLVVPPDEVSLLASETPQFDLSAIDAFASWARAHQLLAATLVQETGLLSGARFGRVALEAYQLAPTLRLISKPRPSLLIADDVGLGKTIEAGLAMLELLARGRARRILVVTPPGLLLQWQEELSEKFGLQFTLIENAAGLARVQTDLPAGTNPWDALPRVLTSLDFLKKETVRNRALRKRWDLIIVDEAHALAESGTPENPYRTQRTRLGYALRENARGLVLLTATPHNGYVHSFRSLIELVEPSRAVLSGERSTIAQRVDSAMIRRMKSQITRRRPDGTEEDVFPRRNVDGIPVQINAAERELLHKVAAYCSRTARAATGTDDADLVTFAMQIVKKRALSSRQALEKTLDHRLTSLRKAEDAEPRPTPAEIRDLQADLPLDEATAERTALRILRSALPKEERQRKAEVRALNGIRRLLRVLPPRDPKIDVLLAEVRSVLASNRADRLIVFTEYLDTLQAIQAVFEAATDLAGQAVVLRGGLSGRQRVRVQQKFEEPHTRVLLSTDAASEGLNLQHHCHRVIHVELPWNPNRLEQRNGRVDRYGQTQPPEIRYLYYPDSPEDDVLHRLVEKIEHMQRDRVSTPDILGVLSGAAQIDTGLVDLDPEAPDVEVKKQTLVRLFDDRTADFVRNVQPLVTAGGSGSESGRILDLLTSAGDLLSDNEQLENVVAGTLGPNALKPTDIDAVFHIEMPARHRGPGVQPIYPRATFRRSIAVRRKAEEVEFITPLHPLVQALAADARRRLVQVYPDERGLPPRRLAARRVGASEVPSVVFTFLGAIGGGAGLLEERMVAIRLAPDLQVIGTAEEAALWLDPDAAAGEVPAPTIAGLFAESFEMMAKRAPDLAFEAMHARTRAVRAHRAQQATVLRQDLEADLADRLREIDDAERRARGLVDDRTQQIKLFAEEQVKAGGFDARRAAARAQAEGRRAEIAEFEQVAEPGPPQPLGALFLIPEGS